MREATLTEWPAVVVIDALIAQVPFPPDNEMPFPVVPEIDTSLVVALPMVTELIFVPAIPLEEAPVTFRPTIVFPSPRVIALPAALTRPLGLPLPA